MLSHKTSFEQLLLLICSFCSEALGGRWGAREQKDYWSLLLRQKKCNCFGQKKKKKDQLWRWTSSAVLGLNTLSRWVSGRFNGWEFKGERRVTEWVTESLIWRVERPALSDWLWWSSPASVGHCLPCSVHWVALTPAEERQRREDGGERAEKTKWISF